MNSEVVRMCFINYGMCSTWHRWVCSRCLRVGSLEINCTSNNKNITKSKWKIINYLHDKCNMIFVMNVQDSKLNSKCMTCSVSCDERCAIISNTHFEEFHFKSEGIHTLLHNLRKFIPRGMCVVLLHKATFISFNV